MDLSGLSGMNLELGTFLQDPVNKITARLAQNAIAPNVDQIQLADLVECNFPGYTPHEIDEWENVDYDEEGYGQAITGPLSWSPQGIEEAQAITAVYLTISKDGAPDVLLWVIPLLTPIIFDDDNDVFLHEWEATLIET